jgi:hypothetical protein
MATLGTNLLTLADWAKRLDPDGKVPQIVELLSQTNGILQDMLFKEGNLPTGHRTTVRTGLPTVFWRLLNQGVQPSKSTTAQIDEACGMLEAWSEVDCELAKLNGNVSAFRLSEAMAFIESMNQEMAQTVFYGNSGVDPEEFNGLAVRYGDTTANNARNIIDGGAVAGQSDCSSIWLVVWGEGCHGIFPKGSKAGLEHQDLGEQTVETVAGATGSVTGNRLRVYQEIYKWKCGIALKDWRQVVRVGSIDISSDNADYIDLMVQAKNRIKNLSAGKAVFYMNRTIEERLELLRKSDVISGGGITFDNVDGEWKGRFRGIPIVRCDALLETEDSLN